ncbi:DUF2147 domain-containing protein [Mucilaginibacter phyllosphaerae]|uniref:DUF2147 domain-containing protein n=1 Tax=Mucilaginibacter phyllosphaerae TaxID=1812349 RepID=A0A4Y8AJC0_9SPHI|nr:DUF2147 domain-containing protein [Mucilaginibacter phyllosphaerae]MBB3967843.1 uncharacterized protein (DUF2147 family) [Mucilaginibacter phyllosphaerae]TEW69113.1 DUF2147 domain-containing protein [Mucilaginibacter phyllosphaerae]
MTKRFFCSFLVIMLYSAANYGTAGLNMSNQVCGKWKLEEGNLIVQVYREGQEYKAKIVWFDDHDDSKDLDYWTDDQNPDPTLRSRKILGMNVLEKLTYNPTTNTWEDGIIYDAKHGKHWNSSAYVTKEGLLKVKGYWHFKFMGKTLTFKRIEG